MMHVSKSNRWPSIRLYASLTQVGHAKQVRDNILHNTQDPLAGSSACVIVWPTGGGVVYCASLSNSVPAAFYSSGICPMW